MASLKEIRQRLRDWAVAREQNAHDEITAAFEHVHTSIADLTEIIDAGTVEEPTPEPEPDPEPEPEPEPAPEPSSDLEAIMGVPQPTAWDQPTYDALYERWEPHQWSTMSNDESPWDQTYYDRGFGYYGAWWRTGNTTYRDRGDFCVTEYRDNYVIPSNGAASGRWCFPEGLAAHYLMSGDQASLDAIRLMADGMMGARARDVLTTGYRDGRIQGRAWLCQSIMYALTGEQAYADTANGTLADMLTWFDNCGGNGAWDSNMGSGATDTSYCGGMSSFNVTHAICYGFVRHHELVGPVSRLNEVLTKSLDRTWTYWHENTDPKNAGLSYIQPPQGVSNWTCDKGSDGPAKDLSLLCSTAYAYGFSYTGHQRFADACKRLWDHGLSGSVDFPTIFMSGNKQFNQSFYRSWRIPHLLGW